MIDLLVCSNTCHHQFFSHWFWFYIIKDIKPDLTWFQAKFPMAAFLHERIYSLLSSLKVHLSRSENFTIGSGSLLKKHYTKNCRNYPNNVELLHPWSLSSSQKVSSFLTYSMVLYVYKQTFHISRVRMSQKVNGVIIRKLCCIILMWRWKCW